MLGGYQILDLRNIDLSRATSASNITNAYVLKQLLKLREHIEKSYDFSQPLNNQLKPVLIRYRDKKVGEKHESVVFGSLEVINTYYKFKIVAENNGEKIIIDVEFEEKTDEYDNKYWDIKTAKILLTQEVQIFENITDKDGHKRFIEGDITTDNENVVLAYGKWSLSGSHLLFVIAGEVSFTESTYYDIEVELPQWIFDKIVPIVADIVDNSYYSTFSSTGNLSSQQLLVSKKTNSIRFRMFNSNPSTYNSFRAMFDILIDNEAQD